MGHGEVDWYLLRVEDRSQHNGEVEVKVKMK
jgi:hypothetical protein